MYLPEKPDRRCCICTVLQLRHISRWNGTYFPLKWDMFPTEMGHVSRWNETCFPLKWDMFLAEMGHVSHFVWNAGEFISSLILWPLMRGRNYSTIVGLKCIFQAFEFLPACRESQIKNENLLAKTPSPTCF